jgi:hypothetical protein
MITAASSAVGSAFLLRAFTPTLGSSSTITNAFGLRIENIGATGVTNAWGIDIAAQSGGSGSNVGLRNAGTTLLTNTTASTSTSSGALVVGNGTSGGLGVGGAIWGGGKVHVGSAGYVDGGAKLNVYATPSDAGYLYGIRLSDNSTATLALGLQTPTGTTSSFIHSNIALGFGTVGTAALNINTSQQVQVLTTTASTGTSSGALVVSGGVGVAGAINGGGLFDFAVSANSTQVYTIQNTSTGASASTRLTLVGGTSSGSIQLYGSGHSTPNILQYASPDTHKWQCNGVERASLSSAGALTVGSSLTTAAPTGGTAAAWKLGTVASVSPTSPNRTIEVDIGGTIYYIHAKTDRKSVV